jgi:CheY-like chemotaxis protein
MPKGGQIIVEADELAASNDTPGLSVQTFVRLRVVDEGEGMDAATLNRAAEPFFSTKGIGKGTGLGLSMVQGLAKQSGGQFVLQSESGRGTTAELWLPTTDAFPAKPIASPAASETAGTRPLVVLAVDDDGLVLDSTIAMLEDLGHTARGAGSAQGAIDLLSDTNDVQLLLTDQAMPGMTGAELIHLVHTRWPSLPIVLSTGFSELKEPLPSIVVTLAKPFVQSDLQRAIADAAAHMRR